MRPSLSLGKSTRSPPGSDDEPARGARKDREGSGGGRCGRTRVCVAHRMPGYAGNGEGGSGTDG
jgi:hypothetical protein